MGFDAAGNASYHWEDADWNLSPADAAKLEEIGWRSSDPILLGAGAISVWDRLRTNWDLLKKGFYQNSLDQAVNPFHKDEDTFRETIGTVCSEHLTLDRTTLEANIHTDTVNPTPAWPILLGPAGMGVIVQTVWAHFVLDVVGVYPSSVACR